MSMKAIIPEGYKKTKVGIIPEDWEVVKFSKVIKPIVREVEKPNKSYWRLGLRSHGKGTFHEFIEDPNSVSMDKLYVVEEDDLIVNITFAWEHAIALAEKKDKNKLVSHRFPTYQFINNNVPLFYKYYVLQLRFKFELENISPGGAGRNRVMSKTDFLKINVLIPPLKEQQKIAEILTTWDEVITKQEQLIKEKEQLKKGLMQNLLSGKVRFSGFSDKWKILHLSKICDVKKGQQLNKLDLIDDGVYPAINGGMNPSGYTNNYNTEANTVTISEGGNCGYVNYITTKFWSGGHCYTLLNLKANSYFVFQYLKLFENEIMKLKVGSGLQNIQKGSIDSFNINLPSVEEQQKIAEVLSLADSEINLLKNELEELRLQKKALMQKLLTGQVRVAI